MSWIPLFPRPWETDMVWELSTCMKHPAVEPFAAAFGTGCPSCFAERETKILAPPGFARPAYWHEVTIGSERHGYPEYTALSCDYHPGPHFKPTQLCRHCLDEDDRDGREAEQPDYDAEETIEWDG